MHFRSLTHYSFSVFPSYSSQLSVVVFTREVFYAKLVSMDHAVKASRSHPWNKLRFENDELEELYQRYTHKIQWISVFGVVTLVVMLTGIMAILSLAYNQAATIHVRRFPSKLIQLTNSCAFFLSLL